MIFNPPFTRSLQIFGGTHTPKEKKQTKQKHVDKIHRKVHYCLKSCDAFHNYNAE